MAGQIDSQGQAALGFPDTFEDQQFRSTRQLDHCILASQPEPLDRPVQRAETNMRSGMISMSARSFPGATGVQKQPIPIFGVSPAAAAGVAS